MKRTLGRRRATWAFGAAAAALSCLVWAPSCSLGEGQGDISGTLNVPLCWAGHFSLNPDFFAAVPYKDSLQIRIQNGGDYVTFSDGLSILVDDVGAVRNKYLGTPLKVALPPEVTPPGVPIQADPNPAIVHMALYLQRTCHTQNAALYVVNEVTLNADGTCDAPDGGDVTQACGDPTASPSVDGGAGAKADATADGSAAGPPAALPIGKSSITFFRLFNGNADESNAAERLTEGSFDVYLADPREICPGGLGPPPRCRGHLTTAKNFKFYFERGRPGQPFP